MKTLLQVLILCVALTAKGQGSSEEAMLNFSSGVSGFFEGTVGWTFTPRGPLAISQLGATTNLVVGQGSVTVGLWSSAGDLLRSVTVNANGEFRNQSFYSTIDPLYVFPTEVYHIGIFSPSGTINTSVYDPQDPQSGGSVSLSSLITLGGMAEGSGGFRFPSAVAGGQGAMWLGPNAVFVPEPGSLTLISLAGLLWAASRRVRRS